MRAVPLIALVAGAAALAGCFGLAATQDSRDESALDVALQRTLDEQERLLEGEFERTADVAQFMAANSAFSDWYQVPRDRRTEREAQATLARLGRIYGARAGVISFVDRSGYENARVVHGRVAKTWELSSVENRAPYFTPTMALAPGEVHVTRPYVSPHTGEWILAAATRIPEGSRDAIVRVELSLDSLRDDMQALAGDAHVTVVDTRTDAVVLDTAGPPPTSSARPPAYIASVLKDARSAGVVRDEHTRASFLRVATGRTNANSWVVIVASERPPALGLESFGSTAVTLLVAGLLLVVLAFAAVRRDRREAADRIAIAMAARDDAERRSRTDALTGLANRRHPAPQLERHLAACRDGGPALGLLLLDVDRFKDVNDTSATPRRRDPAPDRRADADAPPTPRLAGRWGGEEFVVLLPGVTTPAAARVAERCALADRHGVRCAGRRPRLTVTARRRRDPGPGRWRVARARRRADRALYARQARGRDRVVLDGDLRAGDATGEDPTCAHRAGAGAGRLIREGVPALHCQQVADLAARTAEQLGLPQAVVLRARLGGWLHDVGKIAIPDRHPGQARGAGRGRVGRDARPPAIGEPRSFAGSRGCDLAAPAVEQHHERWDGTGYPNGLRARRSRSRRASSPSPTPTPRSRRTACTAAERTRGEGIAELRASSGTHLDGEVVEALLRALASAEAAFVAWFEAAHAD